MRLSVSAIGDGVEDCCDVEGEWNLERQVVRAGRCGSGLFNAQTNSFSTENYSAEGQGLCPRSLNPQDFLGAQETQFEETVR